MSKKKKILLLSDDLRMHSGIATQSKEFVLGTIHKYDWVQLGAAINHPENGSKIDMKDALKKEYGIDNGSLTIYPCSGYGNEVILNALLEEEKPDAILHFTDPRFWIWLYNMEHEIRQNIPIMYYNIWDDLPDPLYNTNYYRSSDLLMGISKQTYGINKRILSNYGYEDWQVKYVPHGVSEKRFEKLDDADKRNAEMKKRLNVENYKYKILYLNRNIRRKQPGDFILAYKYFMDSLTPEQREDCCLIFHSNPIDNNGTDVLEVVRVLCPDYPVIFTHKTPGFAPLNDEGMKTLYNISDVYMNLASNEGFGLGSLEALSSGTPIIVNVTGGLQDQCGFKNEKGEYLTSDDYIELGSNHRGQYKEHGEWVEPVWPSNISLQGSPPTPYIFDDRCTAEDAAIALKKMYDLGEKRRAEVGEIGRQWVQSDDARMTSKHLCDSFIENIDTCLEKWKPRKRYTMEVI